MLTVGRRSFGRPSPGARHRFIAGARDCRRKGFCLSSESGQGLAEYLIIVVIVAIVVIVGIRYFGGSVTNQFQNVSGSIDSPTGARVSEGDGQHSGAPAGTSAGGEGDEGVKTSGGERKGKTARSQTTSRNIDQEIAALNNEAETESRPIDSLDLDWQWLLIIGGIISVVAVCYVFAYLDKEKKSQKKAERKSRVGTLLGAFRRGKKNEGGQAMVEFVFSAITFLFVILGVIQMALMLNAYSLVRYAAFNAARAAAVHGGNEDKMKEAARLSLVAMFPRHGRADTAAGFVDNYLGAKVTDSNPLGTVGDGAITQVKILDNNGVSAGGVVTFDDFTEGSKGVITVQVVHYYELVIPLVNRILYYIYKRHQLGLGAFGGIIGGDDIIELSATTDKLRRTGLLSGLEYRVPIVAHYTIRMQSDLTMPGS